MPVEFWALFHGFLGTLFLMAFSGSFAELLHLTKAGLRRLKVGITVLFVTAWALFASGTNVYIAYRAPVPESARSRILAGPTPWVHSVLMELKEFTGAFVPAIALLALVLVLAWDERLLEEGRLRRVLALVLVAAMLWTLLPFGLGAFITKTASV